jgi:hypothetical protein
MPPKSRSWRLTTNRMLAAAAILVAAAVAAFGIQGWQRDAEGPTPTATPAGDASTECPRLTASVPSDLTRRTEVLEDGAAERRGWRVTHNEPSLRREVSLSTGAEPVTFMHGEPRGLRRSRVTVQGQPAMRYDTPSGDVFVHWRDPGVSSDCSGYTIVTVGLSDPEVSRVLASVRTSR